MAILIFSLKLMSIFSFFPSKEHLSFMSHEKEMFLIFRRKNEKKYMCLHFFKKIEVFLLQIKV